MIRALLAAFVLLFAVTSSNADCVTTNQTASGPPYAEFDLKNGCRGNAIVHWTRRGEKGALELGSWHAGGCKTTHHQYFPGEYSFTSIEFPQGGNGESCLDPGDSAKRNDPPNQKPSSDLAKLLEAQKKANAARATKASEQEQEFKKRYEDIKTQEQTRREQAEKEQQAQRQREVDLRRAGAQRAAEEQAEERLMQECAENYARSQKVCSGVRKELLQAPGQSREVTRIDFQLCSNEADAKDSLCRAQVRHDSEGISQAQDRLRRIRQQNRDFQSQIDSGAFTRNPEVSPNENRRNTGRGCYSPMYVCINTCLSAGALNCSKQCRESGGCFN